MPQDPLLHELEELEVVADRLERENTDITNERDELLARYNALENEAQKLRDIVNSYYLEVSRLVKIGGSMAHIKEVQKQAEEVCSWLVEEK